MARTKINSVYEEQIVTINISDMITNVVDTTLDYNPGYYFDLKHNYVEMLQKVLEELDFNEYDYITTIGTVYWCGILYAYPFDELVTSKKFNPEENSWDYQEPELLNMIKENHLQIAEINGKFILKFHNPTSSPFYRFFNKYKSNGGGGNITASISSLIEKCGKYLENEFSENMETYGEFLWDEEEVI